MESIEQFTFSELLERAVSIARKWAWLIMLCSLVAGGVAYGVSRLVAPVYRASTIILIDQSPDSKTTEYTAILTSERLARTYANLLASRPVFEGTISSLGLSIEVDELKQAIQIQPIRDTQLLSLQVEDNDPLRAASIANKLVEVFSQMNQTMQQERFSAVKLSLEAEMKQLDQQIKAEADQLLALPNNDVNRMERSRIEGRLSQDRQNYNNLLQSYEEIRITEARSKSDVVQAEKAVPPGLPVRPKVWLNTLIAALVGMALSFGGVYVIEALDDTVKRPDQINRDLGLPVLGVIPRHNGDDNKLVCISQPLSSTAESFRSLRTNIQYSSAGEPLHALLIISPEPEAGKSTVSANLSVALAQSGERVTLVDTDLRRPRIHKLINLPNHSGLTSLFVTPETDPVTVMQQTEIGGLSVVTSGEAPPNPYELLSSRKMAEIVGKLKDQSSLIVIDTAPVAVVSDAVVLSHLVDGVVLVIRPGKTSLKVIQHTLEQFKRAGSRVLGVVLNDVEMNRTGYKPYYREYSYHASGNSNEEKVNWVERLRRRRKESRRHSERVG